MKQSLSDRQVMWEWLTRVIEPVWDSLSRRRLHRTMSVEHHPQATDRHEYTHLEALGRSMAGIGPWLAVQLPQGDERQVRDRLVHQLPAVLEAATSPCSADRMNFDRGQQPLVDAAFLAQGLLRCGPGVWGQLPTKLRRQVCHCLSQTRSIRPHHNNWLLFSAMIEAFFAGVDEPWDALRIDHALKGHIEWYKGDGAYGDGPAFHWDYYNSFVIHPMLIDVLATVGDRYDDWRRLRELQEIRAQRFAVVQERMIAPDGSFPVIGRSLTYRCGAFHALAQCALRHALPAELSPAQVRGALLAVIRRTLEAPGTFDAQCFLQIGLCGHQPELGESYISTGSLYLCLTAFLPLGLPPDDPFWIHPPQPNTWEKAWHGQAIPRDHALKDSHPHAT